jgi:hypothetical protein
VAANGVDEEKGHSRGGPGSAPYIAARGGGRRAARWQNWGWQSAAVATVGTASTWSGHRRSDRGADKGAPRGFDFSNLSKIGSTWK